MSGQTPAHPFPGLPFSAFVRILPYIEQSAIYQQADFNSSASGQPAVVSQRIPLFVCPIDPAGDRQTTGMPPAYPATYGFGAGDWFVEYYPTGQGGNGAFPFVPYPSQVGVRLTDITDGLSGTVGMAEVKAFGPHLNRSATLGSNMPMPATPADIPPLGGAFTAATAHSAWAPVQVWLNGITFVFPPNTMVPYVNSADGQPYDVDWDGGGTSYSYAAITARSYHPSGVNALLMDGSVRFVNNSIAQSTWQALGTRNGGEPVGDF
jgi:prepilin-type processing-associated H-X9-DG protein